jgi:hypothetical protein
MSCDYTKPSPLSFFFQYDGTKPIEERFYTKYPTNTMTDFQSDRNLEAAKKAVEIVKLNRKDRRAIGKN